jgi:hypothetical protein
MRGMYIAAQGFLLETPQNFLLAEPEKGKYDNCCHEVWVIFYHVPESREFAVDAIRRSLL